MTSLKGFRKRRMQMVEDLHEKRIYKDLKVEA